MRKRSVFSRNPEIMGGSLCIHGTRIPVSVIQHFIEEGFSTPEIINQYPHLTVEQIEDVRDRCGKTIEREGK